METDVIIESIDFLSHDHFVVYFKDGTLVTITAQELKERFADRLTPSLGSDDD